MKDSISATSVLTTILFVNNNFAYPNTSAHYLEMKVEYDQLWTSNSTAFAIPFDAIFVSNSKLTLTSWDIQL